MAMIAGAVWSQPKQIADYQKQVASIGPLTDELVVKYIRAQKKLKEQGADFLTYASAGKGKDGLQKFEGIVQAAGFTDYAQFLKVNARIAWAFGMSQGTGGIQSFDKQYDDGMKQFDEGIAQLDTQIADPEVPEESKKELRTARSQLVAAKAKVSKDFQKNKKYAKVAMDKLAPLTNKEDTEVVMRYQNELMEVFTGLSPAQMQKIQDTSARDLRGR
jgi:hypothetical protein